MFSTYMSKQDRRGGERMGRGTIKSLDQMGLLSWNQTVLEPINIILLLNVHYRSKICLIKNLLWFGGWVRIWVRYRIRFRIRIRMSIGYDKGKD